MTLGSLIDQLRHDEFHHLPGLQLRKGDMGLVLLFTIASAVAGDAEIASRLHELFPNVPTSQIQIRNGQGRVTVDPVHQFCYFVFTPRPTDPGSKTLLIPMATSRFGPGSYQTQDFWKLNKGRILEAKSKGLPVPREDPAIVSRYLSEHGLSTNPFVYEWTPSGPQNIRLKDFLLDALLSRNHDQDLILYRGGERAGELHEWKRRAFPRGARYWTPDATYAWRYARKDPKFLDRLVDGEAPLFKFRVSKADLKTWVDQDLLTFGTEMTAKAHAALERHGQFEDHLFGDRPYLGSIEWGVEIEARLEKPLALKMPDYFAGPITIDEMVVSRSQQLESGYLRQSNQDPGAAAALKAELEAKLHSLKQEQVFLHHIARDEFDEARNVLGRGISRRQITNVDGVELESWMEMRRGTAVARARLRCARDALGGSP